MQTSVGITTLVTFSDGQTGVCVCVRVGVSISRMTVEVSTRILDGGWRRGARVARETGSWLPSHVRSLNVLSRA